jgi:hypothetical protein
MGSRNSHRMRPMRDAVCFRLGTAAGSSMKTRTSAFGRHDILYPTWGLQ